MGCYLLSRLQKPYVFRNEFTYHLDNNHGDSCKKRPSLEWLLFISEKARNKI